MKILQLINRFPWPLKDGGALGYYNFTKAYHEAGIDLYVMCFNTSKHQVDFEQIPESVKQLAKYTLVPLDNRVKFLDALKNLIFTNDSYHVARFISKDFETQLTQLLEENNFDVVVFESVFMAPYLKTVRAKSKALCVLRAHNVEYEIWDGLALKESNPIKKIYLKILAKRLKAFEMACMNEFDALSFVTETDALHFKKFGLQKPYHIAPTGIDISRLKPNYSIQIPNTLLHIGSMDWMPNQEAVRWFIENVWPSLSIKFPQLIFKVAGRNMPADFFNYQGNGIEILGEVEDAVECMNQATIMLVPLFSGSGIRVKILEGMALGKCIVSTSLGFIGIAAQNGIQIHVADDKSTFIAKLSNLLAHPLLISETGKNARTLIEKEYESSLVMQQLLNFYNQQIKN